jgi:hypothetical protein
MEVLLLPDLPSWCLSMQYTAVPPSKILPKHFDINHIPGIPVKGISGGWRVF